MEQIIIVAVAVIAGGALGAGIVWRMAVRPLEGHVRALAASCDDMGWLMGEQRNDYRVQVGVLEERVRSQVGEIARLELTAELDAINADYLAGQCRALRWSLADARSASALALTFYGKALERAA